LQDSGSFGVLPGRSGLSQLVFELVSVFEGKLV
jgi:hypothetical protein